MVTRSKAGEKAGKVKVGKLKVNKETVKDLTGREKKKVKGGVAKPGNGCDHTSYICSVKNY